MKLNDVSKLTRAAYRQGHRRGIREGRDIQAKADVDGFTRNLKAVADVTEATEAELQACRERIAELTAERNRLTRTLETRAGKDAGDYADLSDEADGLRARVAREELAECRRECEGLREKLQVAEQERDQHREGEALNVRRAEALGGLAIQYGAPADEFFRAAWGDPGPVVAAGCTEGEADAGEGRLCLDKRGALTCSLLRGHEGGHSDGLNLWRDGVTAIAPVPARKDKDDGEVKA